MSEPNNHFVEVIRVWKSHFSCFPAAVIIYDSNGGEVKTFRFIRAKFQHFFNNRHYFYLFVVIEVQLGRQIWGSRDHFKIITSKGAIVEIQRKQGKGNKSL